MESDGECVRECWWRRRVCGCRWRVSVCDGGRCVCGWKSQVPPSKGEEGRRVGTPQTLHRRTPSCHGQVGGMEGWKEELIVMNNSYARNK